jgi:hypothetical protein
VDVARILVIRANRLLRQAKRRRRRQLERELAGYVTAAERRDLEVTLDRYPDGDSHEVRSIMTEQAAARRRRSGCGMAPP